MLNDLVHTNSRTAWLRLLRLCANDQITPLNPSQQSFYTISRYFKFSAVVPDVWPHVCTCQSMLISKFALRFLFQIRLPTCDISVMGARLQNTDARWEALDVSACCQVAISNICLSAYANKHTSTFDRDQWTMQTHDNLEVSIQARHIFGLTCAFLILPWIYWQRIEMWSKIYKSSENKRQSNIIRPHVQRNTTCQPLSHVPWSSLYQPTALCAGT